MKSADFSVNLPLKIPRNFAFFSAKYQKPWYVDHKMNAKHRIIIKKTSCKVNMVYTALTSCQKMLIIIQMHAYKANNYV